MAEKSDGNIRETLDRIYASESRRILATLIRLLGDFDLRGLEEKEPVPVEL